MPGASDFSFRGNPKVGEGVRRGLKQHKLKEEMLATQKEKVETLLNEWKEVEASSKYLRRELEEVRQKIHGEEILSLGDPVKLSHLQ